MAPPARRRYLGAVSAPTRVTNALQDSVLARIGINQSSGQVGIVWQDSRDGNTEIYFTAKAF